MKPILIGLLTAGTTLAGYTAYQSNPSQFAPLVSRIQAILPAYQGTSYQASAPTYSVPTDPARVNSLQTSTSQATSGPTYVELMDPHVQAAFAPLEADRGTLSEEPVIQLREWFLREREREEALAAVGMLDRVLLVMREREHFRERLDSSAGSFSDQFFRERIFQEWLARSRELAILFDRDWAAFAVYEGRFRQRYVEYHRDRVYFDAIARDEFRPRYGEHPGTGFVFAKVDRWERRYPIEAHRNPLEVHHIPVDEHRNPLDTYRNPLEVHHNPLDEHHIPLEVHHNPLDHGDYHNPLETNARPEIGHVPEHHSPVANGGYHNPLENNGRPLEAGHVAHGPTSYSAGGTVVNHPTTTAPHPVVVHPTTTVVAPVTAAGGA